MSYTSYLPSSYQNETKICINGVELLNRHELSSTQDRELQRFIDNNAHIVEWKERDLPPPPPPRKTPNHKYDEMRRSLSRGPSPLQRYNSMDKLFTVKNDKNVNVEQGINPNDLPICPNIEGHNYTNEFPGLEYYSDNKFIEDLIKTGHVSVGSTGLISQPGSRVGSAMSAPYSQTQSANSTLTRQSHTLPHQQHHQYVPQHQNNTNYYTTSENTTTTTTYHPTTATFSNPPSQYGGSQSHYGSLSNMGSNYGTLKGGMKHTSTLPPTSPYSSLKRKGVSWLDQERARSLSPGLHQSHSTSRQVHQQYNRPASTIHTTTYTTTY